jgi:phage tail tube protein FII
VITDVRILCRIDFPSVTARFWDGSGPYIDDDGFLWRQGNLVEGGLDAIEMAINAEAFTLVLGLSGLDRATSDLAWSDYENGEIIGAKVQILTQDYDHEGEPAGGQKVRFTGRIDDIDFEDAVSGEQSLSTVKVSVTNRFTLRNLVSGAVLSDVDQKARAFKLNGNSTLDRLCERIVLMIDKTVRWPNW